MGNQFNRLEYVTRELQKYYSVKKVAPAIQIGGKFLPVEMAQVEIARRKIRFISFYLTSKGVRVKKADSTESIYFFIRGKKCRVSDHAPTKELDNLQFIIRYDSCVVKVLSCIRMANFKLDEYYG